MIQAYLSYNGYNPGQYVFFNANRISAGKISEKNQKLRQQQMSRAKALTRPYLI